MKIKQALSRHIALAFVLIGSSTSNLLMSHDFQDIDLSRYDKINLKPKCVEISYQYAYGPKMKTTAILQPYKDLVEAPDGWGGYIRSWESKNRGPAVELRIGYFYARRNYTGALTTAGLEKLWCAESAWTTFLGRSLGCATNGIITGSKDYKDCQEKRLREYHDDIIQCNQEYEDRLIEAVVTCDTTIDTFLDAYSGCSGIDELVEAWNIYWNNLALK